MFSGIIDRLNKFQKIKFTIILFYFILNAFLLILAFQMNVDDLKFLVRMARYIPYFRYIASANMLLIILVISMNYLELKKLNKSINLQNRKLSILNQSSLIWKKKKER